MNYYSEINGKIGANNLYRIKFPQLLQFENIRFPAGELQERCPKIDKGSELTIFVRFHGSDDIIRALLQKEAFLSAGGGSVSLFLSYMCYSRQDRSVFPGDPFALKVLVNIIKSAGFKWVYTLDQHSNVTEVLFGDNFTNFTPENELISFFIKINPSFVSKDVTIIAPDAGAIKRTENLVKSLHNYYELSYNFNIAYGSKKRDLKTGRIIGYEVFGDIKDNVIVLDELADGGGTFLALANALKERPKYLSLFVTHGIFSKGLEELKKSFDFVGTTSSFYSWDEYKEKFGDELIVID